MALTSRSNVLKGLEPIMRRSIDVARIPPAWRDDALQLAMQGVMPYVEKLRAMEPQAQAAYVYQATTLIAYRLRSSIHRDERVRTRDARDDGQGETGLPRVADGAAFDEGLSPHDALVLKQRGERMTKVLLELNEDDMKLVARIFGESLSEREAAERLQVSRGAIVRRARSLREELKRAWLGTTSWFRARK